MHTIETEILFMTENISLLVSRYHTIGRARECVLVYTSKKNTMTIIYKDITLIDLYKELKMHKIVYM